MSGFCSGRPNTKGGKGKGAKGKAKSKLKVWCKVPGCTITPHANNLKKHYISLTNEEMLNRLNQAVGDKKLERLLSIADKHTKYMFRGQY